MTTNPSKSSTRCPLCAGPGEFYASAQDIEYFTSDTVFSINICPACDVLYVQPMLQDKLGDIYPDNYYSFSKPRRNFVTRVKEWLDQRSLKSLLESLPGKDLKVLDIGGGSGWLAGSYARVDPRVSLTQIVDLDDAARSLAEQSGHRYFCGRIEEFVTDERYDVILMLNLIEHVSRPAAAFS